MNKIHIGDTIIFRCTFIKENGDILNISNASYKKLAFKKSDNSVLLTDGTFTTDGTDGKLEYKTTNSDIDITGELKVQGHIIVPGYEGSTDITEYTVYPKIVEPA